MIKKTKVDITPDKSLIKKLGLVGYRTEQAIAELIDNSYVFTSFFKGNKHL